MTTYIALFSLTDAGIKAAKDSPRRLDAAKKLLTDMGGEIKQFYMMIGDFDFVGICEAPDDAVMARYPRRATAKRSKSMTGRQKRYWRILATFLLGGAVAGVAYNVVRGHLAPIYFATGAIFGLLIASGIGAFEALVSQGPSRLWLRSLPLAGAVVVRSFVYAAVIFPIQYCDLGVKVIGLQSTPTPKEFWSATADSIGVSSGNLIPHWTTQVHSPHCRALPPAPGGAALRAFRRRGRIEGTAERLGDRRSHTMLDRVFSVVTGPVLDFGGEIDQYVGDEMIVTWQAAGGGDGRALHCFLAMREALAKASRSFEREFGHAPQVRGSLHFGPVVVGEIFAHSSRLEST